MTVVPMEKHNYTAEQARDAVLGAVAIVMELEVPDDLRVAAFNAAVNMLSAKRIELTEIGAGLTLTRPGAAVL